MAKFLLIFICFDSSVSFAAVDLESIGLDKLDNQIVNDGSKTVLINQAIPNKQQDEVNDKTQEKISEKSDLKNKSTSSEIADKTTKKEIENTKPEKQIEKPIEKKIEKTTNQEAELKDEKNINQQINQTKEEVKNKLKNNAKNNKKTFINNTKKANLAAKLARQKIVKKNKILAEKKQKEQLKKLNLLREKYLKNQQKINNKADISEEQYSEDFLDSEAIIPKKKNLNNFLTYEAPPPPIASSYRTSDNINIPLIMTKSEYVSILFSSIAADDIRSFDAAFKKVEEPNIKNEFGDTLLTYSILLQRYEFIASILLKGADPNMANNLGFTPLRISIELQDAKIFEILLKAKADIFSNDINGQNYLMHSARVGFLFAIDNLIKNGIEVNILDRAGYSALAIANQNQQRLAATLLIKNGADKIYEQPYDPYSDSIIRQLENKWNQ